MTIIEDENNASRERFRTLFLGIPIPSYIWKKVDNNLVLSDFNYAAEEISQGKVKKRLEVRASDLYKDESDILEDLNRCYDEKICFSRKLRHKIKKSGEKKHLLVKYNYISPDMVLVHVEDITKRKQLEVQIKQSEVRYHALFEHNISACAFQEIVYDSKGNSINYRFTEVNSMFEKILSVNRDDVIGKLATNVYKTLEPLNIDIYSVVAETMEPTSFIFYFEPMNKYFKISVFTCEKGKFITVFEDISDQIGAELRLIESEKKFRSIIESTSDAIVLAGLEANYLYSSPQYSKMIGGIEINYNSDLFSVFHPDDLKKFKKIYFKAVKEKGVPKNSLNKPFEIRLLRNDCQYIWVSCSSKDYFNDEGELIGFINTVRDITERKEAEQALKESEENLRKLNEELENRVRLRTQELVQSEEKYKDIIERNYDGYFETDIKGILTFTNKRVCEILEYSEEELLGRSSLELIDILDRNRVSATFQELFLKELPHTIIECVIVTKSGKLSPIEAASYLKYDSKGNKIGFYVLSRDINIRKLLEESEKKYREAYNLAEIYKDIFAHDISNILQNILSSVELNLFFLKGSEFTHESEKNLELIKDQVKNGALLVSNVRKLSQIEQSPHSPEKRDYVSVLKEAIKSITEKFHDKDVNIQLLDSEKHINIYADEFLIDVFENLLFNGVKHNENSSIEVHVKSSEVLLDGKGFLKIEFIDNGIGVEDIRKNEIFQRKIKNDKSVSGIGFGLLLTKKIIDGYKGKIWVEDKVVNNFKKGSNFILLIPLV